MKLALYKRQLEHYWISWSLQLQLNVSTWYLLWYFIMFIIIIFAVFIAHNWLLATDVVRIDLKRSVSISSFANVHYNLPCPSPNPYLGPCCTHTLKIDLKRSFSISTFAAIYCHVYGPYLGTYYSSSRNWSKPIRF